MSNDSWEYQGRQQHMWFGHGTKPKSSTNGSPIGPLVADKGGDADYRDSAANLVRIAATVGREVHYCQLPDGRIVPYIDLGDGYAAIPADAAGQSADGLSFAAGRLLNEQGMPTLDKRGGIAGGGPSGPVTSPGSKILREMTGRAKLDILRSFGLPSTSIGGAISHLFPYLGVLESFLGFL